MPDSDPRLDDLYARYRRLIDAQNGVITEINALRRDLDALRNGGPAVSPATPSESPPSGAAAPSTQSTPSGAAAPSTQSTPSGAAAPSTASTPRVAAPLERFIGENLISIIGIVILVIGVAIGVRFVIEQDLISPLTRVVLGYAVGVGLVGFAERLRRLYGRFSAVLLGGGMALLYFLTYVAYDFYALVPQGVAFTLMVAFTAFTALAALRYDRQLIAHLGLVGAYAVPFLLGGEGGSAVVLLGYVALVNLGILALAFARDWRPLYYVAFVFSWLVYGAYLAGDYEAEVDFAVPLAFATVYFLTFYGAFLAYKLVRRRPVATLELIVVILNAAVYYGMGYGLLTGYAPAAGWLGAFTLANAAVHLGVAVLARGRGGVGDRRLLPLVAGLALVFVTAAIPVQLDGNYVTLLWAGQAALLFWLGRSRGSRLLETLSYPLFALALGSLVDDWDGGYGADYRYRVADGTGEGLRPLLNPYFLSSVVVAVAFALSSWIGGGRYPHAVERTGRLRRLPTVAVVLGLGAGLVTYLAFYLEVDQWFRQLAVGRTAFYSLPNLSFKPSGQPWEAYRQIALVYYSLAFAAALAALSLRPWIPVWGRRLACVLGAGAMLAFLTVGLYAFSDLRDLYVRPLNWYVGDALLSGDELGQEALGVVGRTWLLWRYLSLALAAGTTYTLWQVLRADGLALGRWRGAAALLGFAALLWVLTSEMIQWLDFAGARSTYKLGVSILRGVYALALLALGLWRRRALWRQAAIALFALTLVKLFFYDLASLDTLARTIVLVALGVLLLLTSFLYSKYKYLVVQPDEPPQEV